MKLTLEKIIPEKTSSWMMMNRQLDGNIPFEWHHHREYELTLTLNSQGQRYIGDHIGAYGDGDLVLLGPNLPHTWHSSAKLNDDKPHHAIVMWFDHEWAEQIFNIMPELRGMDEMLSHSRRGIQFSRCIAAKLRTEIISLVDKNEAEKTTGLLTILQVLSADKQCRLLASPIYASQQTSQSEAARIDRVLKYIHEHYAEQIKIDALANLAALSHSGFYRMFLRYTHHRPRDYIIRLRIGKACALLIESHKAIAYISDEVGFNSLANFNRQFKRMKNITPRQLRNGYSQSRSI